MLIILVRRPGGATVARLTPDQKVACSNHVRVNIYVLPVSMFCIELPDRQSAVTAFTIYILVIRN